MPSHTEQERKKKSVMARLKKSREKAVADAQKPKKKKPAAKKNKRNTLGNQKNLRNT